MQAQRHKVVRGSVSRRLDFWRRTWQASSAALTNKHTEILLRACKLFFFFFLTVK